MLNVFIYVYINFFMLCHVILGCQVVSPVAVTHCEKSLSSHGDPKPERKGDLAASEVWIFLVQMFSKKCEIGLLTGLRAHGNTGN